MAIQVNGTTVIDNSRVLSNVTGLKTINSTSILGSGNIAAGASTTWAAVGTYTTGLVFDGTIRSGGYTYSGSDIYLQYFNGNTQMQPLRRAADGYGNPDAQGIYSTGLSGTWRLMAHKGSAEDDNDSYGALFVRIS